MKRTKFSAPTEPTEKEQLFIDYMEHTNDSYGLKPRTLATFLQTDERTIRKYMERYNNFKYLNYTPKGKIHNINGLYKLVTNTSKYRTRYIAKAEYDLICAAIAKHNTNKILGHIQAKGQLTITNIAEMDYETMIDLVQEYEELLK